MVVVADEALMEARLWATLGAALGTGADRVTGEGAAVVVRRLLVGGLVAGA